MTKFNAAAVMPHSCLTVAQASVYYNIPKWKFYQAIGAQRLPFIQLCNGRMYLRVSDIERMLDANKWGGNHA